MPEVERRAEYLGRAMKEGLTPLWALISVAITLVGGSVTVAAIWGVKHLIWVPIIVLLVLLAVLTEGSYRMARNRETEYGKRLAELEGERDAKATELEDARRVAIAAQAGGSVSPEPADWNAYCDYFPPGFLMFNLRHRLDNLAAVFAFSAVQCAVTDPDGVPAEAEDRNISNMKGRLMVQYTPSNFPGAPPVRSGTYRFVWTGQNAKGIWHEITRGSYEVPLPEAADPALDTRP
jgi:hypothetical protein